MCVLESSLLKTCSKIQAQIFQILGLVKEKERLKYFFSSCCDRQRKKVYFLSHNHYCVLEWRNNDAIDMGEEPCQLSIEGQDLKWKLIVYMQWTPTKLKPQPIDGCGTNYMNNVAQGGDC